MIAFGSNSLCKQAELYYYDFILDENRKSVPEFIIDHIEQCQHCQEQLSRLKSVLSQTEDYTEPEQEQVNHAVTAMLKLHFAYIGEAVTCKIVRPFLPNLSDPDFKIRIPTPITAHLDNCRQCSEDLETIRKLDLSRKQLRCLSRFFADSSATDNISCTEAQDAIPPVVSMVFSEVRPETLKHLCTCPECSELLYQYREMTRRGLLRTTLVQHEFPCEKVSARDFFDYVIPYEIDPPNDQYVKFRESLISHLRICPSCLAKMQQLHTTIYGIYQRAESDVATIYQIGESAKTQIIDETEELYADFPIRVEVKQREEIKAEQPVAPIDFTAARKQTSSANKIKPFRIGAVATAAAVIFITAIFLRNTPTAGASALEKIYNAVAAVKNVHIASFVPDSREPIQEKWVSRTLNIYMTKTAKSYVLWDVADGVTKIKHLNTGIAEIDKLTTEDISDVEKKMSGSVGLMPFDSISGLPENAELSRVADEDLETYTEGIEVYELTWDRKKYGGSVTSWKWRAFVDADTNLPQRAEWYVKLTAETDYILDSVMIVKYLSETEMQNTIKKVFF